MPIRVLVNLTREELRTAAIGGIDRALDGAEKRRRSNHPETPDWKQRWFHSHTVGAIGEFAVAKAFDIEWDATVGRVDRPDVGNWEVKTTDLPVPKLRYWDHKDPTRLFVLASYKYRTGQVLIQGWLPGAAIKALNQLERDGRVYTATVDQLHNVTDLPGDIQWGDAVRIYE